MRNSVGIFVGVLIVVTIFAMALLVSAFFPEDLPRPKFPIYENHMEIED